MVQGGGRQAASYPEGPVGKENTPPPNAPVMPGRQGKQASPRSPLCTATQEEEGATGLLRAAMHEEEGAAGLLHAAMHKAFPQRAGRRPLQGLMSPLSAQCICLPCGGNQGCTKALVNGTGTAGTV